MLEKGYESQVIDYDQLHSIAYFESIIKENDISEVHYCNPVDYEINERLNKAFRKMNVNSKVYDSPSFLLNHATVIDEFSNKKTHGLDTFVLRVLRVFGLFRALTSGYLPKPSFSF